MSRSKIIEIVKEKNPQINNSDLEDALDIFCHEIINTLKSNGIIEIRGFGTFFTKKIKEKYSARNPKTGEIIYVPEKNKIRFKASRKLNEIINE